MFGCGSIKHNGIKIFYNFKLLFPGKLAIMLFGKIFTKMHESNLKWYLNNNMGKIFINHERIHMALADSFKLKYFTFYLLYILDWVKKLFKYGFNNKAYREIYFEREAYANEENFQYLKNGYNKNYKQYK